MKRHLLYLALLATSVATVAPTSVQAADLQINGFISVVGGKTLSEGKARVNPTLAGTEAVTYQADAPSEGIYDDSVDFKPDSSYGVQVRSDLGSGLSVTGQITGHGGEDFEANISWAYVAYQINDEWSVQAGRQRLPLYYYSDFLDVGYAYHWIRTPQELPAAFVDTLEGVKVMWTPSTDNWDWRFQLYAGGGKEDFEGGLDAEFEDTVGFVANVGNDWLQLRATYMQTDTELNLPIFSRNGVVQGSSDNLIKFDFTGVAAHMTFDNVFVVAEYARMTLDEPIATDQLDGTEDSTTWYISSGIRLGSVTPHITYTENTVGVSDEVVGLNGNAEEASSTWTVGVRWDFHPSAALKVEYLTRSDDSDSVLRNAIGGFGYGDRNEVDLISAGIDVIF